MLKYAQAPLFADPRNLWIEYHLLDRDLWSSTPVKEARVIIQGKIAILKSILAFHIQDGSVDQKIDRERNYRLNGEQLPYGEPRFVTIGEALEKHIQSQEKRLQQPWMTE